MAQEVAPREAPHRALIPAPRTGTDTHPTPRSRRGVASLMRPSARAVVRELARFDLRHLSGTEPA